MVMYFDKQLLPIVLFVLAVLHEESDVNSFDKTAIDLAGPHDSTLFAIKEDEELLQNDIANKINADLCFNFQVNSVLANQLDMLSEEDISILSKSHNNFIHLFSCCLVSTFVK